MSSLGSGLKVLYSLAVPPILVLAAAAGGIRGDAFWLIATIFIILGGVCAVGAVHTCRRRYAAGIGYVVVLEIGLLFLR